MPPPTNPNAPSGLPHGKAPKGALDQAAGYRPSISFDQALAKLPHAYAREKLQSYAGRDKMPKGKPYNTNPWINYPTGKKGKEFDLDGGVVWRLIRHSGSWFLAHHIGANNGFELWHITGWPAKTPVLLANNNNAEGVPIPPNSPNLSPRSRSPSIGSPGEFVSVMPVVGGSGEQKDSLLDVFDGAEFDDWEAAGEFLMSLKK